MKTPLRILYLEDDPADVELIRETLETEGFAPEIGVVQTEADYLAQLDQDWEIILVDYKLPQFDGMKAIRLVKERGLDLSVIFISGAIGEEIAVNAIRAGASDYVMKDKLIRLGPAVKRGLKETIERRERKQSEEQLTRQTALLNDTQQLTHVGGWQWNVEEQTTLWTDELYRIHGFSPDEFEPGSPKHIERGLECYDPEDRPTLLAAFERCVAEGTPYNMEIPFTTADGVRKWIRTTARAVWENDRIARVFGNVLDITEHKRVEEALYTSEEMMRNSQAVAHICAYSTDLNVNEVGKSAWVCSPEFYKIFGIDENYPHTIDGWANLIHPDYRKVLFDYHESVVKERKRFCHEYKIIRISDGAERWVHGTGELEFDEKGNPIRMHGAIQDITERKQMEKALVQSEALKSKMVANIADVIVIIDSDSVTRYESPNIEKLFGWKPEELVGRPAIEYVHPEDVKTAAGVISRLLETPNAHESMEVRYRCKDGSYKWIRFTGTNFMHDPDICGVLGNYHDISERKQSEEVLKEKIKELERFNKAAVGRELRMIQLKKEINELCQKNGKDKPY